MLKPLKQPPKPRRSKPPPLEVQGSGHYIMQQYYASNIAVILHPGQSPDLNPIEGIWLILKQRAKRRIQYPKDGQKAWDGTKTHLKEILQEVWASITLEQIRDRIVEMPERCSELSVNGGGKIRSATW
ncbi:hypothetical protein CC86DRAFT_365409 [Ophiobolus disseminans]|uniref:Tc1-like transposase DDE domain-containing protein n=1 Tax=Ophiobolus disseminans TaxID=1469910 RepID=A0A6A7AK71_9PLEO|nr:hypothetical protein CC86DRAFT_365409 [Ophiobolus disseminans]